MDDALHAYLTALPEAPPSPALWTRLAQARQRQLRRRRGVALGLATGCLALGVVGLFQLPRQVAPASTPPQLSRAAIDLAPATSPAPLQSAGSDAVRALDRELQLAYARNASDAELGALWDLRRNLLASHSPATQPVDI